MPQRIAETQTAELRPNDEKAHESERTVIGRDGTPADQSLINLGSDERIGVGRPEDVSIMQSRVPALLGRPIY
jgi:hypothetical protein